LSANQDEYYTYDGLYQISTLQRGTLNSNNTGINGTPTWEEDWNYDATGNWHGSSSAYLTKVSGTTTLDQNRTHNEVNEITNITESTGTAWPTPGHDAAGNLTSIPQPLSLGNGYTLTWDAWNRLMTVKAGSTTVATYAYDGATRRVSKNDGTNTRNYYYSDQWQVLEERLNSSTSEDRQYVWGILSIDDLILRDNGSTRKYALKDAMGSVTAVVNTSGTVQERYGYSGFGIPRYMTASFGSRTSSSYDWETLFDGYRYDTDTGLYQVRYRYLHPNLGRWVSRDPLGDLEFEVIRKSNAYKTTSPEANVVNLSEESDLFRFDGNSPINKIDRWGLDDAQCAACWDQYKSKLEKIGQAAEACLALAEVNCTRYAKGPAQSICVRAWILGCGAMAIGLEDAAAAALAGCLSGCSPSSCTPPAPPSPPPHSPDPCVPLGQGLYYCDPGQFLQ
jgi:RHS repeat-associated protein